MMARRAEVDEPVLHTGVNNEPHLSDWSSWHPAKWNARLCPADHEIRSCGVPGCSRHQIRPLKEAP